MTRRLNFWLLVVTLVFAGSYYLGRQGLGPLIAKDSTPRRAVRLASAPEQQTIHLLILNGTGQAGLARDFSLLVARAGCVCEGVGDYPGQRVAESFLINRRLTDDRARLLAAKLGRLPVLREWDSRTTEDAVLVLGQDHDESRRSLDELHAP